MLPKKLKTNEIDVEMRFAAISGKPNDVSVRRILKSIAVASELTRLKRSLRGVIFQLIFPL